MTDAGLPASEHLEHLDTDTVADLIENLLPATEAHHAREHVKACPQCQQLYDALVRLSEDLAEEGRRDIPMPADIADHLDGIIASESTLRASTVGVHSLAQIREQPRRHLPRIILAAAAVLVVAFAGVTIALQITKESTDGAAGITPTEHPTAVPTLSTTQVASAAQGWLEGGGSAVLHGSAQEVGCARNFAAGQQNPSLELVQPVTYEGRRATVIGIQAASPRDIRVFVVTGCDSTAKVGTVLYDTTVTLRNR